MNNGKQNLLKIISQHFVNALKLKISSRIENYVKFIFNATENFHAKRNANQHKTLIKRKLISRHFSRSIWKCEERNFNKLCYLMKSHVFISVDVSLWAENISLRFSLHKRKYSFNCCGLTSCKLPMIAFSLAIKCQLIHVKLSRKRNLHGQERQYILLLSESTAWSHTLLPSTSWV